jgi:peptidoglycan hydrolase CwlO-like protein
MTEKKNGVALIISDKIGQVLISVIIAGILGGIGFSYNTYAEQQVMKGHITEMKQSKLPERMGRVEEKINNINKNVDDVKQDLKDLNKKVDKLLQALYANNH